MLELLSLTRHNERATNAAFLFYPKKTTGLSKLLNQMPDINPAQKPIPASAEEQVVYYRDRLEEVAELVAHIRHEINNPLTGVLGQAQLLLREELGDRARKRVETIEELAIRLRDIVAQLREVQKP
jgi:signal transduction histidine kinase